MKKKTKRRERIEKTITYELTKDDIIEYLRLKGEGKFGKDTEVTVQVRVPGGGDWSNTDLEIGETENPIQVIIYMNINSDTEE